MQCDGRADALGGSGDDGDFSFQLLTHFNSPCARLVVPNDRYATPGLAMMNRSSAKWRIAASSGRGGYTGGGTGTIPYSPLYFFAGCRMFPLRQREVSWRSFAGFEPDRTK